MNLLPAEPINILIADDHAMFRDTLQLYISQAYPEGKFYMASDLHEVVDVLNRNSFIPDLCIIDFMMPGMKGVESVNALIKSYPDCRFAVMSGIAGQKDIESILNTDVVGFLPKTLPGRRFIQGIEIMLGGEKFIPYEPDRSVMPSYYADLNKDKPDINLTVREKQVLGFICEGKSNSEIAEFLSLKVVTVKLHVRGIFQKLDCANRTQAAIKAREWGIFE